jgi:hypothetical protein
MELNLAGQAWLCLQTPAGSQSRLCCLNQTILVGSLQGRFAIVADTQPVAGVIKAIVALVAYQNHSRTGMDVPIVRDIQQEFAGGLILNPVVKDWNQVREVKFLRILHEELYVNVLKFHGLEFSPLAG